MTEEKVCSWQEDTSQPQIKQFQKQFSRMVEVAVEDFKVKGRPFLCSRNLAVREERKMEFKFYLTFLSSIVSLITFVISFPVCSLTRSLFRLISYTYYFPKSFLLSHCSCFSSCPECPSNHFSAFLNTTH